MTAAGDPPNAPASVVILGGGTAGWMAACLLRRAWPACAITLVESPDVGIIGVGEGSTPQLRHFFATLGIDEREWMAACDATYKVGIAFADWSEAPGHARYFHPFASEVDGHTEPAFHAAHQARRAGLDVPAHPDRFFLNTRLAAENKGPQPAETFPFQPGYGYHFDAHRLGGFLAAWATARGVTHLRRHVRDVVVQEGRVERLVVGEGEGVAADWFVDASGFRARIARQALGARYLSFADNLFNDRAVVMPTPAGDPPRNHTTSTALGAGWAWHIPLTSRTGNGYVYSSRYCSPEAAEAELRAHLGVGDEPAARHLELHVGRLETSWTGNCLAIGLAQGFIEPLEATALHIVQATVEGFIAAFDGAPLAPARDAFNARIARRYEGVRDYIVAHYRMNRRTDTAYWRDNAAHDRLSDDLKAVMTCWFTGGDLARTIHERDLAGYYAPLSWGCLLAGYGVFPPTLSPVPARDDGVDEFLRRCALNFASHADALERLTAGPRERRAGEN